ncbi:MAG TPA: Sir2 family NAD-dependent protein deacetylase [Anaeromyxobacteraceae bacterium]|nr:Sir2 family NAD-dependent protein deacetylase [Anaeromyxobacteraceae bacterium]
MRRIAGAEEGARELARVIARSRSAVVFTGAGISTESGIPDFRSPGGIWTRFRPVDFADFVASEDARREAWRRRFALDETLARAAPNRGHRAVAELVRRGLVSTVVTQNVDGLHQASGVPEEQVVELHGNTTYARCLGCGRRHELAEVRARFERDGRPPSCGACGGHVKTATISFGQPMPPEAMARAAAASLACDLFLAAGSSLVVHPAASFPVLARRGGARLAILNREPTGLDDLAELVLNAEIGPTLGGAVGVE